MPSSPDLLCTNRITVLCEMSVNRCHGAAISVCSSPLDLQGVSCIAKLPVCIDMFRMMNRMCHVYRGIGDDLGRAAARGFGPNAAMRHT